MSLSSIINELVVSNVSKSIEFYNKYFEFDIKYTDGTPIVWAQLEKDGKTLMLEDYKEVKKEIDNYPQKVNNSNLIKFEYSNIEDIKELYEKLKDNEIEFFSDYTETDYGKAEFGIYDLDRNMILTSALM